MAINATNPVIVDGVEYPHYAVQLVVSPQIGAADVSGSLILRMTPYRVRPDNTIEALGPEFARSHIVSGIFARAGADPQFGAAMGVIYTALAQYIAAKEL